MNNDELFEFIRINDNVSTQITITREDITIDVMMRVTGRDKLLIKRVRAKELNEALNMTKEMIEMENIIPNKN